MAFDRGDGSTGTGATSILPIVAGGTGANTALTAFSNLSEGNVVVNSSGNVGIGTNSPIAKLDVVVGADERLIFNSFSGYSWISSVNAANSAYNELLLNGSLVLFATGALERMRIDSSGNVGIGTSSPARKLHVSDVMRLEPRNGAPSSPAKGDIYFDSADDKLKCYDGSVWQDLF
jgi:hypothetical protein